MKPVMIITFGRIGERMMIGQRGRPRKILLDLTNEDREAVVEEVGVIDARICQIRQAIRDVVPRSKKSLEVFRTLYVEESRVHHLEEFYYWLEGVVGEEFQCLDCQKRTFCVYGNRQAMMCCAHWMPHCIAPELQERYLQLLQDVTADDGTLVLTEEIVAREDFYGLMILAGVFSVNFKTLPVVTNMHLRRVLYEQCSKQHLTETENVSTIAGYCQFEHAIENGKGI